MRAGSIGEIYSSQRFNLKLENLWLTAEYVMLIFLQLCDINVLVVGMIVAASSFIARNPRILLNAYLKCPIEEDRTVARMIIACASDISRLASPLRTAYEDETVETIPLLIVSLRSVVRGDKVYRAGRQVFP